MEQACRRCGTVLSGAAGARIVCSSCGNVMTLPTGAPAPAARRSTAPGSFTPVVEPAPVMAPPGGAVQYSGPQSYSTPAILALVFGILPWLVAAPSIVGMGEIDRFGMFGSGFGIVGIGLGVAAIVLGFIGLRQCNREPGRYKGKGFAIAGLTLGIVFTTLWVVALVVMLVFCLIYFGAYGNSSAMMAPCPAVAMQAAATDPRLKRSARVRMLLAHHPECAAFREDVLATGGLRLCASCAAFATTATITGFWLLLAGPSASIASTLIVAGALLILLPQTLSALRWTQTRVRKMAVKATMGYGAAILFTGLFAAPWPEWVRLTVFASITLAASLLVLPRRRRLLDEMSAHRHGADCGAPTPSV